MKTTVNELDLNFHQPWIRMRRFFCPNQVISKKKIFTTIETVFRSKLGDLQKKKKRLHQSSVKSSTKKLHFSSPNNTKSFTTSAPRFRWRLFSFLEQKSSLKALKNVLFWVLFRPVGGSSPPSLATLPQILVKIFFYLFWSSIKFRNKI